MTRKRCIKGWSILVLVVLFAEPLGAVQSATAVQEPSTRESGRGFQTVPQSDPNVQRLVGVEAWRLLEEKVISKNPAAWEAATKTKEARGWKKTDNVVALRARHGARFTRTQAQAFDIGGALLIEWEWACDPYHVCGTYYFESYADGGSITYDAEFVPTSGWGGYSPWANLIGSNPGRDSRRQRASFDAGSSPAIRLASVSGGQRATPDDANCPGDLWRWNQCMRDCLARRHEASMIGVAGAVGGSLMTCARAVRPGPIAMMGVSYLGCLTLAAGTAALTSFSAAHYYSPCDSHGGQCGPRPC
jgi:hypothetical protein